MNGASSLKKEDVLAQFERFINIVRGRKDAKSQVQVLSNPENFKTMSVLTGSQAEFVQDAFWLYKVEPKVYEDLKDYAQEMMEVSPSRGGGRGRDQVIAYVGALSEKQALHKLGVLVGGKDKNE